MRLFCIKKSNKNTKKHCICSFGFIQRYFCLRPSAKDQGITWVLLVLVHHLIHFLLKIKFSEKNFSPFREKNFGPLAPQPSALSTEQWQHWYNLMENYQFNLRISKTTLSTLDQYWSTLVLIWTQPQQLRHRDRMLKILSPDPRTLPDIVPVMCRDLLTLAES